MKVLETIQQGYDTFVSRRTVIVRTVALWTLNEIKLMIVGMQSSLRPENAQLVQ